MTAIEKRSKSSFLLLTAMLGVVSLQVPAAFGQTRRGVAESPNPPDNNPAHVVEVFNWGVLDPVADRIRAQGQFLESWANARRTYIKSLIDQEKLYQERVVTKIKRWEMHDWKVDRDWENWQKGKDRILENKIGDRDRHEKAIVEVPPHQVEIAGGGPLNVLFEQIKRVGWSEMDLKTKRQELPEMAAEDLRFQWGSGSAKVRLRLNDDREVSVHSKMPFEKVDDAIFNDLVRSYQNERKAVLEATTEKDRYEALGNALDMLDQMAAALKRWYGQYKPAVNTDPMYVSRKAWSNYIDDQLRQMRNQTQGHSLPAAFNGKTVQELLDYMKRYGLSFGKADKGGENTYLALHNKMRDIINELGNK